MKNLLAPVILTIAIFSVFAYAIIDIGKQTKLLVKRVAALEAQKPPDSGCPMEVRGMPFTHSIYREHFRGVDTGALTCFYQKRPK